MPPSWARIAAKLASSQLEQKKGIGGGLWSAGSEKRERKVSVLTESFPELYSFDNFQQKVKTRYNKLSSTTFPLPYA